MHVAECGVIEPSVMQERHIEVGEVLQLANVLKPGRGNEFTARHVEFGQVLHDACGPSVLLFFSWHGSRSKETTDADRHEGRSYVYAVFS